MNENLFRQVKNKLNSEFYRMNDEWLRDCLEFYLDQNPNPPNANILEFVKAQWQLSDLREINNENGSLPRNLSAQKSTTLSENYILQVEQMYDISTSKYKQLEQIRNTHISQVDPTESEKSEKWEPPKKRMMQLKLTDGLQDVIGIEYQSMPILNETLLPGYKVMIIGPLKCRKGVLFLEQTKFKKVGGEVDNLLIPNALENVLARALQLKENPDPYNDNASKPTNNDQQRNELEVENNLFEGEFDINLDEVSKIEQTHHEVQPGPSSNPPRTERSSSAQFNTKEECYFNNEIETRRESHNSNNVNQKIKCQPEEAILDDDDFLLEMIDEEQFIGSNAERKISVPSTVLPKKKDDDLIVINDENERFEKKETQRAKNVTTWLPNKAIPSHSRTGNVPKSKEMPLIGEKRSIPLSPPVPAVKKGKIDRKITEFAKKTSTPDIKISDFICDINNDIITEPTRKIVYGRVESLGKLSKKNSSWILDATIVDGTGQLEVIFSNKVLEGILGFSVEEFSRKKEIKEQS